MSMIAEFVEDQLQPIIIQFIKHSFWILIESKLIMLKQPRKKSKRASIALKIMMPVVLQRQSAQDLKTQHISSSNTTESKLMLQNKSQLEAFVRINRLMIAAYEINRSFNRPILQGNILIKVMDQILDQIKSLDPNVIEFDHSDIFQQLFAQQNDYISMPQIFSGQLRSDFDSKRSWNVANIKELVINVKRQIILRQIAFLINRVQFSTNNQKQQRLSRLSKRQSILNTLKSITLSQKDLKNRNLLQINQQKSKSLSSSQQNQAKAFQVNYIITWNPVDKEYHNLFNGRQPLSKFIQQLNELIKIKIAQKQETSLLSSLFENIYFTLSSIFLITLGLILSSITQQWQLILIQYSIIVLVLLFQIYKFIRQDIYSNQSYRQWILSKLQTNFEENSLENILELDQHTLDIKVFDRDENAL